MLNPNMIFSIVLYVYICCFHVTKSKQILTIFGLTSFQRLNREIMKIGKSINSKN